MWAHYGGLHKGICLEIDEEEFINENKEIIDSDLTFLESIIYSNDEKEKPSFTKLQGKSWDSSLNNFIKIYNEYLFFNKSIYWEKEDEKRLVVVNNGWDGMLSIKKSLKSIIIGTYCSEKYLPSLNKIIHNTNIKIKQCIPQLSSLKINIEELEKGEVREHILKKYIKDFQ